MIRNFISYIKLKLSKGFNKNVFSLVSGNSLAVLITVITSPLLTRLFTEDDFGRLTIFVSIIAIITSISTGRYDFAIIESRTKRIANHLALLGLLIAFVISSLSFLFILIVQTVFKGVFFEDSYFSVLLLIPIGIFLVSFTRTAQFLFNREHDYVSISKSKILKAFSSSGFQILAGFFGAGYYMLIAGKIVGDLFTGVFNFILLQKKGEYLSHTYSLNKLKYVFKKYSRYLKVNSLHSLFNTVSSNSIPLVLGFYFSSEVVGEYGLSFRVCILPVTLISHAVFQVFSREVSIKLENENGTIDFFKSTLIKLVKVSVIPFLVLLIFGKEIFSIFFGENWIESGLYAQILSPYLFFVFLVAPFTFIPLRLNRHFKSFMIELISMFLKLMAIVIGANLFGIVGALVAFTAVGILMQCYLLFWIHKLLQKRV